MASAIAPLLLDYMIGRIIADSNQIRKEAQFSTPDRAGVSTQVPNVGTTAFFGSLQTISDLTSARRQRMEETPPDAVIALNNGLD